MSEKLDEIKALVAAELTNFAFTQVFSSEDENHKRATEGRALLPAGYETWHCRLPKGGIMFFDIMVTPSATVVSGDIDGLIFSTGKGIAFLAGDDVEHRIHDKLEGRFKERDVDEQQVREYLFDQLLVELEDAVEGQPFTKCKPADNGIGEADYDKFDALLVLARDFVETYDPGHRKNAGLHAIIEAIEMMPETSSVEELNHHLSGCDLDLSDVPDFGRPSARLLFRLYLVNEVARRILAHKSVQQLVPAG